MLDAQGCAFHLLICCIDVSMPKYASVFLILSCPFCSTTFQMWEVSKRKTCHGWKRRPGNRVQEFNVMFHSNDGNFQTHRKSTQTEGTSRRHYQAIHLMNAQRPPCYAMLCVGGAQTAQCHWRPCRGIVFERGQIHYSLGLETYPYPYSTSSET